MRNYSILILSKLLIGAQCLFGQVSDPEFLFPIRPGEANYLAGTMGEIRSNHFHAGIDIKTSGVTGLPVFAAADGYVSRIKISTGGYGNALYLQHPSGRSSVYAHLEGYQEEIQSYVRQAQYEKESFTIELFPQKDRFPVKKGEVIGYSGNSGSSTGPHLHFEIRDANQKVLDPLKFGFKEVVDDLAPIVSKVAMSTMDIDARINGEFGKVLLPVSLVDGEYKVKDPVHLIGKIGIAIYAYDRLNGASNRNGIPCLEMMLDNETIFSQNIAQISFGETRQVINHMDYPLWQAVGNRYNKLYVDHGTTLNFLPEPPMYGTIDFSDSSRHTLAIRLTDSYNNTRPLEVNIDNSPYMVRSTLHKKVESYLDFESFEITHNTLELRRNYSEEPSNITLFADRLAYEISPAYLKENQAYYLWDLRAAIPDSADMCGTPIHFDILKAIPPSTDIDYFHNDFQMNFSQADLFDTLFLRYEYSVDRDMEMFHFKNESTPIKSWINVNLKPRQGYTDERFRVYSVSNKGRLSFVGGEWEDETIQFSTRNLGRYTIALDSIAPSIKLIKANENSISVTISDDLSGIKSYRGEINGQWVLLNYDYKRRLLWSEKIDKNIPFSGEFTVVVSDNADNESTLKVKI